LGAGDFPDKRKSESGATVGLGRARTELDESGEQAVHILVADPDTVIFDLDAPLLGVPPARAH